MRGFKAFDSGLMELTNLKMEIGKEYTIKGKSEMYNNGWHFFTDLKDVFAWCNKSIENPIYELEILGDVIEKNGIYCTSKHKIIRKLSKDEVKELIDSLS